jgi:membrane protease YdiL (CAAX protease family)
LPYGNLYKAVVALLLCAIISALVVAAYGIKETWKYYQTHMQAIGVTIVLGILLTVVPFVAEGGVLPPLSNKLLVQALASNFLVAYMEEHFFRFFLFISLLRKWKSFWLASIPSSGLFMLIHWSSYGSATHWFMLLNTFCGGVVLCYLLDRWASIWPCILLHISINVTANLFYASDTPGLADWVQTGLLLCLMFGIVLLTLKNGQPKQCVINPAFHVKMYKQAFKNSKERK